jgi:hypothetical protein
MRWRRGRECAWGSESGGHARRVWCADQFGPDSVPVPLADVPTPDGAADGFLNSHRLLGAHVAAAGEALIEVLLVDACLSRQLTTPFWCQFETHRAHHSDSLGTCIANRSVETPSASLVASENDAMETKGDRRRRKLIELRARYPLSELAKAAGRSEVYLEQVIKGVLLPPKQDGTRSRRELGDAAARDIESAYSLGVGWFDSDQTLSQEALQVAIEFDKLTTAQRERFRSFLRIAGDLPPALGDKPTQGGSWQSRQLGDQQTHREAPRRKGGSK